jgi:hypothetical protein
MASDASAPSSPSATVSLEVPPPPNVAWAPSTLTEDDLLEMEVRGLLSERAISGWKCFHGQEFPTEDWIEMVVFWSFYEKGLGLPAGSFFHVLLHYYGLEVRHLKPNSIVQIAIFIHLCKGFLGIVPHFNLWRTLYHLRAYLKKGTTDVVGGATFSLC